MTVNEGFEIITHYVNKLEKLIKIMTVFIGLIGLKNSIFLKTKALY
jgi:hypothetical protein